MQNAETQLPLEEILSLHLREELATVNSNVLALDAEIQRLKASNTLLINPARQRANNISIVQKQFNLSELGGYRKAIISILAYLEKQNTVEEVN